MISVAGAVTPGAASEGDDQKIVLVRDIGENEDVSAIEDVGDVIDRYGSYLLLEAPEMEIEGLEEQYDIDWLEHQNELNVKGHVFDTNEGYPDFDPELMIDEYEEGEKGIYIVDMIGPVNPEWREKLEDLGVEPINYQRNYAYEVRMTPELAEDVEELFFVDWVGIYQPEFKLAENLEISEMISIRLVENASDETFDELESLIQVYSTTELATYGIQVIAEVEDKSVFSQLAGMREVYSIDNHLLDIEFDSEIATQITGGGAWIWDPDDNPNEPYREYGEYGSLVNQLGYTGEGVTIAVADNGFWEEGELDDFQDRVDGGAEYEDGEWIQDQWGINRHGTHVAGIAAGNTFEGTKETVDSWLHYWYEERDDRDPPNNEIEIGDYYAAQGAAPNARLYLQDFGKLPTEEDKNVEDFYSIPLNAVENSDAYIHTNSWFASGLENQNDGKYLAPSEAYDKAVRDAGGNNPLIIVSSAGNAGYTKDGWEESTIGSPGTGKNEITVGATETYNPDLYIVEDLEPAEDYHVLTPYESNPNTILKVDYEFNGYRYTGGSSLGWTNDRRVKPDVVAPGSGILSTDMENENYWVECGTSMSTPNVAGQAAVIVEWYEEHFGEKPSPAMVKALLINTAEPLVYDGYSIPNKGFGWGMVNLADLVQVHPYAPNFILEDQNALLETGEQHEYAVTYENELEPLKISLVWTDKEALVGDDPTLKNDLNLEVVGPNGGSYRGNAFDETGDGYSDSGFTYPNTDTMEDFDGSGDGWDDRNNVQNVYIHPDELEPGTYTIRIIGENIPEDGTNDGWPDQDYALVVQNGEQQELYHDDEDHDLINQGDYIETGDPPGQISRIQVEMDYVLAADDGAWIALYIDDDKVWEDMRTDLKSPSERKMTRVFEIDPEEEVELKVVGDGLGMFPYVALQEITISARTLFSKYTLTLEAGWGGTTNPSPGSYTYLDGEEVNVGAIPGTDYEFDYWEGDCPPPKQYNRYITIEMDEDKYLKAHFSLEGTTDE